FMPADDVDVEPLLAAAVARLLDQERQARADAATSGDPTSPWAITDGWRLGHGSRRSLAFGHGDRRVELHAQGSDGDYRIEAGDNVHAVAGARLSSGTLSLRIDGHARRFAVMDDADAVVVHDGARRLRLQPLALYEHEAGAADSNAGNVAAPMPGRVVLVKAAPGDTVEAGQEVMVIEAMKMELSLKAPRAGTVAEVRARAGDFVDADAVLLTLEDAGTEEGE